MQLAIPKAIADAAESSFHARDGTSPRSRPVRSVAARPDDVPVVDARAAVAMPPWSIVTLAGKVAQ